MKVKQMVVLISGYLRKNVYNFMSYIITHLFCVFTYLRAPFARFFARKKPIAKAIGFFQRNPPYRVGEIAPSGGEIVLRTVKFALRRVGGFHFTTNEVRDFTWAERRFHILRSKIFHYSFRCWSVTIIPFATASKKQQLLKKVFWIPQNSFQCDIPFSLLTAMQFLSR